MTEIRKKNEIMLMERLRIFHVEWGIINTLEFQENFFSSVLFV